MDELRLYAREEGPAAMQRIRAKVLGTAAVAAAGAAAWSMSSDGRSVIRTVPALTANTAVAATAFAVCQEGVRAVRQGDHDAWNSFIAGGLTGAAMTRFAHGRGFQLLGAVMWAPLCGGLHWLNATLQPSAALQAWLVSCDLLDAPLHKQQQQQQQQQQPVGDDESVQQQPKEPIRFEDMSWREKARAVQAIKQRELQVLHEQLRAGGVGAAAAAADDGSSRPNTQKRWWLF